MCGALFMEYVRALAPRQQKGPKDISALAPEAWGRVPKVAEDILPSPSSVPAPRARCSCRRISVLLYMDRLVQHERAMARDEKCRTSVLTASTVQVMEKA
jgi:hypothetical protein